MRLVELEPKGKIVFAGDTHGEYITSKKIIDKYSNGEKIVFLGDYVDRGPESKKNIDFLLEEQKKNCKKIILLGGNHEGYIFSPYTPTNFWSNISAEEILFYSDVLPKLPYALSVGNILALHGIVPYFSSLNEFNEIKENSPAWWDILWGDFKEEKIKCYKDRPMKDSGDFKLRMNLLSKKILIRSHQAEFPLKAYENQCLTLFTSSSPHRTSRTIAIVDYDINKEINSIDDLTLEEVF